MFIIIASRVVSLGLEVKASGRASVWKFSLRHYGESRICRDCEAEISRSVLMVRSHVHVIACVGVWNFGT